MNKILKQTCILGLALSSVLFTGVALANTTFLLKIDNQSSQSATVVISKSSDSSNREQKVVKPGETAKFDFNSACNKDKTKKRDYLVYKGKYPSSGGNTIVGSGSFWMTAVTTSGHCSKTFEFNNSENNSGTGITIEPTVDGARGGTLKISDS